MASPVSNFRQGFKIVVRFGAATNSDEGGEENFSEGIIDFPSSGIVDLVDGGGKSLGDGFEFSAAVVLFDGIDDAFHDSSVSEKRNANNHAHLNNGNSTI